MNPAVRRPAMFFTFPEDVRWYAERQAVEFGVEIGEYLGVVRVPRCVFQRLLPERPTLERCVEAYHLLRTHCRAEAPTAAVDRGWQCRDQRAGLPVSAERRRFQRASPKTAAVGPKAPSVFIASETARGRPVWS